MRRPTLGALVLGSVGTVAVLAVTALAAIAATTSNLDAALEAQRKLCAEHPQDPSSWNDLGNLLVLGEHPQDAADAYRKAVELDPKKVSALFNLGLLDQQQGHLKEAMDSYQKVLEIDPNHAWTRFQVGSVYERRGNHDRAIESYARAFAADSQLALPEINPQVLESRLITEAMLRAYQRGMAKEPVRHQYDDPARIAKLLVQSEKSPEELARSQENGKNATVLTAGNLPPGAKNVGQALPPGSAKSHTAAAPNQPYTGGFGPVPPSAQSGAANQNWSRPQPRYVNPADGTQPGMIVTPPGAIYRPAIPSSGQLTTTVVLDNG